MKTDMALFEVQSMERLICLVGLSIMTQVEMVFNGVDVDLVLVFGLMVRRCFHLMSVFVLNKIVIRGFANFFFPCSIKKR